MKAILLCAGRDEQFQPMSCMRPKSLTPVNGLPIVEHTLKMLKRRRVGPIAIVVGYMAEKFEYLKSQYGVELVYNPHYAASNDASSLACVSDRLEDSLVIDGDLFFIDDFIPQIRPGRSQLINQPSSGDRAWKFISAPDSRVLEARKTSAANYGLFGVSYWLGPGARLLAEELAASRPDEDWEEAVLRILARTPVYATHLERPAWHKLYSIQDALDFNLLNHEQIACQCSLDFEPVLLKGLTNSTWLVRNPEGQMRTLRIPGPGTSQFIQRDYEPIILDLIKNLEISPDTRFYPGDFKTTEYLAGHRNAGPQDMEQGFFSGLAEVLAKMHAIPYRSASKLLPIHIQNEIKLYENQVSQPEYLAQPQHRLWMMERARYFDRGAQVLCHRDLLLENILVAGEHGKDLRLIDFEYAGFTHYLWDLASFILEAGLEGETRATFIRCYGLADEEEWRNLWHMEILIDYIWGLWGVVKHYPDYAAVRLERSKKRLAEILA